MLKALATIFLYITCLGCTAQLSSVPDLIVQEIAIELTNDFTTATGLCKISNPARWDYRIAITKVLFGPYEELISWELELSQKYKDRGDVSITASEEINGIKEYTFLIGNVTLEDYAIYKCGVYEQTLQDDYHLIHENKKEIAPSPQAYYDIRNFTLNYPICSSTPVANSVSAGSEVSLSCIHAGSPPLTLQWYTDNGTLGDFVEDRRVSSNTLIAYNQLRITLNETYYGTKFTCMVSSSNGIERQCVVGPFHVKRTKSNHCNAVKSRKYPLWIVALVAILTGVTLLALIVIVCLISRIRNLQQPQGAIANTRRNNLMKRFAPPSTPPPKRPSGHHYDEVNHELEGHEVVDVPGRRSDPNVYVYPLNSAHTLRSVAEATSRENDPHDSEHIPGVPREQRNSSGGYVHMAQSIRELGAWLQEHDKENVQSIEFNKRSISIRVRRKSSAGNPPYNDTYDVNLRRMSQTL